MRDKFMRFMYGRYGADELSKFLFKITIGLCFISLFLNIFHLRAISSVCYWLAFLALIYTYVRMFSKNIQKRYDENQRFLYKKSIFMRKFNTEKSIMSQRKYYHFYRCPSCNQRIRIPKGKGKIEIRCPKCNTTFIKKS